MSAMRPVADADRGSGTVLLVGVVAVAVALLAGTALLVGAERARAGAQSAADLAALAAAARLVDGAAAGGGGPCAVAAAVATRNGARLVACRPGDGGVVTVTATRPAAGVGPARATARAGPAAVRGPP